MEKSKTLYIRTNLEPNSKKGNRRLVRSKDWTKWHNSVMKWRNKPTELNLKKLDRDFNNMKNNSISNNNGRSKQMI
jgi:hypothetical protein